MLITPKCESICTVHVLGMNFPLLSFLTSKFCKVNLHVWKLKVFSLSFLPFGTLLGEAWGRGTPRVNSRVEIWKAGSDRRQDNTFFWLKFRSNIAVKYNLWYTFVLTSNIIFLLRQLLSYSSRLRLEFQKINNII